jgi:putative PEP-CTERM system TPR-repeat lipoprotein
MVDGLAEMLEQRWWLVALRGLLGILFGIICFGSPAVAGFSLMFAFAIYSVVDGGFGLAAAFGKARRGERWVWLAIEAVANIVIGVLMLVVVPDLARAMLQLGHAKKVVDEFGPTQLAVPAEQAKLQTLLAGAYGALGKPEQAKAALAAALAADPKYAEALLFSARQKAAERDIDGALAVVDDILAREPGNADAWKLKGDLVLYGKNQPEEALAAYRKTLAIEPKYMAAHVAIFGMLMRQGKLDDASKQLEELKSFAAKNPQTRFLEAQLAYQKKDFKAAREIAQALVQQASGNPRVLELAGATELQAGAVAQAQVYLEKALQLAPALPLARRLLIVSYLRSGQPARALAELNTAAGKDGLPPALYSLAGEVYLQNGDAKKAEEYFAKALKLDPDDARKRTALAITHLAGGKGEAAIDELQDIAAADSGVTADLALISAHLRAKDFAKALAAIDKLQAKQPDKPLAANLRGRVLLAQKDAAGARKSFEKALSIDPTYFAAAASLAAMDLADKKPDDAKKRFEALLARNPKNGQALLALAQLAANQKAPTEEIAGLLGRAIDANPTDVAPRLLLIDLHLRNKDNKQALAVAQAGATALPNSPEVVAALGRVQQVSGDVNQAMTTYSKLVSLQPLSPVPLVRLAEAQTAAKDYKAAEQSLRKALDLKPDLLDAQRGLILLSLNDQNYKAALAVARQVQQQRPKEPMGKLMEGDIEAARKGWPAAIDAYRQALQIAPVTAVAIKLHAALKMGAGAKEADQFAQNWLSSQPKDAGFMGYLGEAAIAASDYPTAQKRLQAVLQLQPDSAVALNNLAWVDLQLKQLDDALRAAEKANALVHSQPAFMDTLAAVLSAKGEHRQAIELQGKVVALQPDNHSFRMNLAKIYVAAGEKAKAAVELDVLAKLGDKFRGQQEVAAMQKAL